MLVLVHNNKKVVKVFDTISNSEKTLTSGTIINELFAVAASSPDRILIWCREDLLNHIDYDYINEAFYLKNLMMCFGHQDFLIPQIGYVEDSPFLKVNKQVKYPTWLMSSMIGVIYTSELIKYKPLLMKIILI